jgi:hypothetical protein
LEAYDQEKILSKDLDRYGTLGIDHLYKNSAERFEERSQQQGQLAGPTTNFRFSLKVVIVVIITIN